MCSGFAAYPEVGFMAAALFPAGAPSNVRGSGHNYARKASFEKYKSLGCISKEILRGKASNIIVEIYCWRL